MVVVRVAFEVQPTSVSALQQHIAAEVPAARAVPGCQVYAFWQDPTEPCRWLLYEEWANAEAFAAYKASPLFAAAGRVLFPMMVGKPSSADFEAAQVGP